MDFIPPCIPMLRPSAPTGPLWKHEFKFDGYRIQIHKRVSDVVVYSRRGANFTRRAGRVVIEATRRLSCATCVLDAELIAFVDGVPSFKALHEGSRDVGVVAFDILEHDDVDLRAEPLAERRRWLATLFPIKGPIALSEAFDDPKTLLVAAEANNFEGIVSKRVDRPYRSGLSRGEWIKVKTAAWWTANRERGRLFQKTE